MKVTEVKIFPVTDDKLKAFVSVVLDNCFMVNDIKVIEGKDGRFISMPSRRKRNGKFKDIAHPLNSETRGMLEAEILGEYERTLDGTAAPAANGDGDGADEAEAVEATDGDGRRRPSRRRRSRRRPSDREPQAEKADGPEREAGADVAEPSPRPEPQPEPQETDQPSTLEEVTEKHLSDSFWTS